MNLDTPSMIFQHSDACNLKLLQAAMPLRPELLDRNFEMGRGRLRKTLIHIQAGEDVWLQRWQGNVETPWPDENAVRSILQIKEAFHGTWQRRTVFLSELQTERMNERLRYRDSKGGLFSATLNQMILQSALHSVHHRAQAVNMIRHLTGDLIELDYMVAVREHVA